MDEAIKAEIKRIDAEDSRQNHRLQLLEQNMEVTRQIATSIEKMALTMEQMLKEQEEQGKRLDKLEKEPAEIWSGMKKTIFNTIIGAIAGAAAIGFIQFLANAM